MFDQEKIKEYADEYAVGQQTIQKYCETLLSYPFIIGGEDEYFFECLETILIERPKEQDNVDYFKTIEKCIYRIYGDDSIPYLSDEFKQNNGLEDE